MKKRVYYGERKMFEYDTFEEVINALDGVRVKKGNGSDFVHRMLLEDYDGDDLAQLLKPLLKKWEELISSLCFLFLTTRSVGQYYITSRATRGKDTLVRYRKKLQTWSINHPNYSPSNFFRTGQFGPEQLSNTEGFPSKFIDQYALESEAKIKKFTVDKKNLPNNFEDKESNKYGYIESPLYSAIKESETKSETPSEETCATDSDTSLTFRKFKEVYDRDNPSGYDSKSLTPEEVQKRVREFSEEVLSESRFSDQNGCLCDIDYLLPFFFKDGKGDNKYYGRVRCGFSKRPDEKKLEDFFNDIFRLVSSLYDVERSRKHTFSEKDFKRRYGVFREERLKLLDLVNKDVESVDEKTVHDLYQEFITSVVTNDPCMKRYKGNLCLVEVVVPRDQFLRHIEGSASPLPDFTFYVEPKDSGNVQRFNEHLVNRPTNRRFSLSRNKDFQYNLELRKDRKKEKDVDNYKSWIEEPRERIQQDSEHQERYHTSQRDKIIQTCKLIREEDFPDSLPFLSDFIVEKTIKIKENRQEKKYYLVVESGNLFKNESKTVNVEANGNNQEEFGGTSVTAEPKRKVLDYPLELGVWSRFSTMKKGEFRDASKRLGSVLVGIPFKFSDQVPYQVLAIFSPNADFMDVDAKVESIEDNENLVTDQHYFDVFYDVFYDLFKELDELKRVSSTAGRRGREIEKENDFLRLLEASYQDGHAQAHLMRSMLENIRTAKACINSIAVVEASRDDAGRLIKKYFNELPELPGRVKETFEDIFPAFEHFHPTDDKNARVSLNVVAEVRKLVESLRKLDLDCDQLQETAWTRDMTRQALRAKRDKRDVVEAWTQDGCNPDWRTVEPLKLSKFVHDPLLWVNPKLQIRGNELENWHVVPWAEANGVSYRPNDFFYRDVLRELYQNVLKRREGRSEVFVDVSVDSVVCAQAQKKLALIVGNDCISDGAIIPKEWTRVDCLLAGIGHVGGLFEKNIVLTAIDAGELFVRLTKKSKENGRFEVAVVLNGLNLITP